MCPLSALNSFKVKFLLMIIMLFKPRMLLIFLMRKHIKRSHQSDLIIIFVNYYKFLLEISSRLLSILLL